MSRRHTLRTCPTCSRAMVHLSLHVCPEHPSIVAWMARNLPHSTRAGYIVPQNEYDAIPDKPLDSSALKRAYGSWAGLAARYGLQCPIARGGKAPGAATNGIPGMDPASRTELHRLADLLHGGAFGPSFSEFCIYAEGAPLTAAGLEKRFGTWGGGAGRRRPAPRHTQRIPHRRQRPPQAAPGAAERPPQFGSWRRTYQPRVRWLTCHAGTPSVSIRRCCMDDPLTATVEQPDRRHNYPLTTCPHCGRTVPGNMADMHDSVCAFHPDKRANTLAALQVAPGVGKTMKQYEATYRPLRGLSVTTLLRQYAPTWAGVLDVFGLDVPEDVRKRRPARTPRQQRMTAKQREEAAIADVAAMEADARRILAAEYDNAHTLHGCAVRDVPGVTIGGRPCVAVMLR